MNQNKELILTLCNSLVDSVNKLNEIYKIIDDNKKKVLTFSNEDIIQLNNKSKLANAIANKDEKEIFKTFQLNNKSKLANKDEKEIFKI